MKYRDTASYGKRREYIAIAELLKRGFDVYMTLVDDQGIDCVIRLNENKYLDIQIKARSKEAIQWNVFAAMSFEPRENLYFIFYTELNDSYWTIPSIELAELCYQNISGKHVGKRRFALPKQKSGLKVDKYSKYKNENGFNLLRDEGK
jgi:hypothetical protein